MFLETERDRGRQREAEKEREGEIGGRKREGKRRGAAVLILCERCSHHLFGLR